MAAHNDETVTLTSVQWHDSVLPQPLRFPPPYAASAIEPAGFAYFWQLAEYAFHLPDPSKIPPLPSCLDARDRSTVARFIASARELAGYSFMSSNARVSLRQDGGVEVISADFGSSESLRAAATLFRQLYGTDAESYQDVVGILSRAHRYVRDERSDERQDFIAPWRKAQGALRESRIQAIVGRLAADSHSSRDVHLPLPFEEVRPTEVISKYLNGDLIHWGDRRAAIAAIGEDDFMVAMDRMNFFEAMSGLAHFYAGFSILLAVVFAADLKP